MRTCGIDDRVHGTESRPQIRDHIGHRGRIAQIHRPGMTRPAELHNTFRDHPGSLTIRTIGESDITATPGKQVYDSRADPAGTTGNQCHTAPPFEITRHRISNLDQAFAWFTA